MTSALTDSCKITRLRGKNNEKYVRVPYDSGSQNSYMSKYAASAIRYERILCEIFVNEIRRHNLSDLGYKDGLYEFPPCEIQLFIGVDFT